ncbi:hypothetical protein D9615_008853 [Tricholomella constricta]|uniref:Ribonuclease H1 N-terminal domain-containing protein n=1 Tax=Tricholomella constricta TaxID=117010 RepID=A0A8H5GZV0_9AGAR|nr:hypothetical protein D9615_008853 [Tricholomella constricta]
MSFLALVGIPCPGSLPDTTENCAAVQTEAVPQNRAKENRQSSQQVLTRQMAQQNHPVGYNNPVSQGQLLAALTLLGIRVAPSVNGDVLVPPALSFAPNTSKADGAEAGTHMAPKSSAEAGLEADTPEPVNSRSIETSPTSTFNKVHGTGYFESRLSAACLAAAATAAKEKGPSALADASAAPVTAATVPKAPPPSPTSLTYESAGCGHICTDCRTGSAVLDRISPSAMFFSQDSWYCVFVGRAVGVFRGWAVTKALTDGVSNCQFKRFASFEAASAAFTQVKASGAIEVKKRPVQQFFAGLY